MRPVSLVMTHPLRPVDPVPFIEANNTAKGFLAYWADNRILYLVDIQEFIVLWIWDYLEHNGTYRVDSFIRRIYSRND
jgi:hypothetical protein